jgi:hypothetical protein
VGVSTFTLNKTEGDEVESSIGNNRGEIKRFSKPTIKRKKRLGKNNIAFVGNVSGRDNFFLVRTQKNK